MGCNARTRIALAGLGLSPALVRAASDMWWPVAQDHPLFFPLLLALGLAMFALWLARRARHDAEAKASALEQSLSRMREVNRLVGAGYVEISPDSGVFRLSSGMVELLELDFGGLYGADDFGEFGHFKAELTRRSEASTAARVVAALLGATPGQVLKTVLALQMPSGHALWLRFQGQAIGLPDRRTLVRGMLHDISGVRKSRSDLAHNLSRLEMAMACAELGAWEFDVVSQRLYWDERTLSHFGVSADDFRGVAQDWEDRLAADDLAVMQARFEALLSRDEPYNVHFRITTPAGESRWIEAVAICVRDAQGAPLKVTGYSRDTTSSRLLQQASQRSLKKEKALAAELEDVLRFTREVLMEAPLGIGVFAGDGQCVLVNRKVAELVGGKVDRMRAMNFFMLNSWKNVGLTQACEAALADGKPRVHEYHGTSTFGVKVWLNCHIQPVMLRNARHLVVQFIDVAEARTARVSLELAVREAREASQAKSDFLSHVSHEVRTPLNATMGALQLLTPADAEQRRLVASAYQSSLTLLGLLNDVLDLAKIEAAPVRLALQTTDLRALLQGLVNMFAVQATSQGLYLRLEADPGLPPRVLIDPMRLRQVIVNLVSNALKFTRRGGVTLRMARAPEHEVASLAGASPPGADGTGDVVDVRFSVNDTGIGIDKKDQQRVFGRFVQLAPGQGGSGLGLSIARPLVDAMGGTLRLSSAQGVGSSFYFTLHLRDGDTPATDGPLDAAKWAPRRVWTDALRGVRVLLVEDDPLNQDVLATLLSRCGAIVMPALDGDAALAQLGAASAAPDVVLTDIRMAGMDGLELTRRIRLTPDLKGLAVIAMSASSRDRTQALELGASDYLVKPLDLGQLVQCLQQHCQRLALAAPPGAEPSAQPAALAQAAGTVLDVVAAVDRLGGEPAVYARLARLFESLCPTSLQRLQDLAQAGNATALARELHSLRGSALTLGAQALAAQLREVEAQVKSTGAPPEVTVASWLAALEDALAPVRTALQRVLACIDGEGAAAQDGGGA